MIFEAIPAGLSDRMKRNKIPFARGISLTYRCNLRCIHCYHFLPKEKERSFKTIKNELDRLAEAGCLFAILSGGEPLLRDDFWEIAQYARKKLFALVLRTNGTLITPSITEKIKQLRPFQVSITLMGAKAETHDRITGVKESFQKTVRAIRLLKGEGLKVAVINTVVRQNLSETEQIRSMADKMGVAYKSSLVVPPTDKSCMLEGFPNAIA